MEIKTYRINSHLGVNSAELSSENAKTKSGPTSSVFERCEDLFGGRFRRIDPDWNDERNISHNVQRKNEVLQFRNEFCPEDVDQADKQNAGDDEQGALPRWEGVVGVILQDDNLQKCAS